MPVRTPLFPAPETWLTAGSAPSGSNTELCQEGLLSATFSNGSGM